MNILVCVKQVPDLESTFVPDESGAWYSPDNLAFRLNEYDEVAIEQAVLLKEQHDGVATTVISIGPDRAVEALKRALAMGIDRGVHVRDASADLREPWEIGNILAEYASRERFDLVLAGVQTRDRGSGQVGPIVAQLLEYPCVTTVVSLSYEDGVFTARRELEGGVRAVVRLSKPAVFTCQSGLNAPRYPTLPNIMKAKKKELVALPVDDLLRVEPLTETTSFHAPPRREGCLVLEGAIHDIADRLGTILREKTAHLR